MATVVFYEKPGCINNTRQKGLLREAGHQVVARNILDHPWTEEELRPFFGGLDVPDWFNPAAPRVKSGEVDPASVDADAALRMMTADPYLIRRPLMQVGRERRAGFDPAAVDAWIGLRPGAVDEADDVQSCPQNSGRCDPA